MTAPTLLQKSLVSSNMHYERPDLHKIILHLDLSDLIKTLSESTRAVDEDDTFSKPIWRALDSVSEDIKSSLDAAMDDVPVVGLMCVAEGEDQNGPTGIIDIQVDIRVEEAANQIIKALDLKDMTAVEYGLNDPTTPPVRAVPPEAYGSGLDLG